MKYVFKSKTFWFNVLYTLAEILVIAFKILPEVFIPYAVFLQGLINIILRVWFTNVGITISGNGEEKPVVKG